MKIDHLVRRVPITHTHIDRYLKWLPAVAVLAPRKLELATAHNLQSRAARLGLTLLFTEAATQGLKYGIDRARPGLPLDDQSFPSSHTSVAVAGAELLRRELASAHSILSWSGYVPAAVTAALRISKRRHWPSDVLAGAMIGVGSACLASIIMRTIKKKMQADKPSPVSRPE